jgi:hypothetical protein
VYGNNIGHHWTFGQDIVLYKDIFINIGQTLDDIGQEEDCVMTRLKARATFLAFPLALQAAMRIAGAVEEWAKSAWVNEIGLVAELLARSGYSPALADDLATVYRAIQPMPQEAADGSKTACEGPGSAALAGRGTHACPATKNRLAAVPCARLTEGRADHDDCLRIHHDYS